MDLSSLEPIQAYSTKSNDLYLILLWNCFVAREKMKKYEDVAPFFLAKPLLIARTTSDVINQIWRDTVKHMKSFK